MIFNFKHLLVLGGIATAGLSLSVGAASAQIACVPGANPNACTIADGVTIGGDVTTNGNGFTINSAGTVGIRLRTLGDNSAVTNSGTVGDDIQTSGDNSAVTNSGTVGDDIQTFGDNSAVTNSGTVGDDIQTFGDNSAVTNSGTVGGLDTFGDNSSITNSGTVSGDLQTFGDNSAITNSGTVGGRVELSGANPVLTLLPGSVLLGTISLPGVGTRTLNVGPGLSIANTFITGPTVINTFGAPFAVNGLQVAVVDTTAMGQADEMLSDLTSGIFNAVHARLSHGAGGGNGSSAFGLGGTSLMGLGASGLGARMNLLSDGSPPDAGSSDRSSGVWGQAFGGHRDEEATSTSAQATHEYVGGIAGLDGWISRSIQIGAFAGGATADLEVPLSQDVDVETFFGGAYANFTNGQSFLRVLLTAGTSDHDSSRRVANNLVAGGLQTATASFDGDFISPEVAVGTTWNLGWLTIEPSARLRYAHLSLDGFAETGAADNFTVGDRDVSLWQGRAQVAFPMTSAAGTLAPRVGIEAWGSDDDTVTGTLLGQAVAFTPGGDDDDVTGFVGATATTTFGTATAFVDGEIHVGDDGYTRSEAHAGIRIPF